MSDVLPQLTAGQFERIAKALADPRRFALLELIAGEEEFPCQRLCQSVPVSKATVSHHIKELIRAGLVRAERHGQYLTYHARRDVMAAFGAALQSRLAPRSPLQISAVE